MYVIYNSIKKYKQYFRAVVILIMALVVLLGSG